MPLLLLLRKLRWPTKSEATVGAALLLVALFISWAHRGARIAELETAMAAKPRVEFRDRVVEKKVRVAGPVHVVTVQAPDGTKTTTVDRAVVTTTTDKARDTERTETPVCLPPRSPRTRFAGLLLGPDGTGSWIEGARGGLNLFDRIDVAASFRRRRGGGTAFGGDVSFRW